MHTLIAVLVPFAILLMMASCDGARPANAQSGASPQDAKSRPTSGPAASGAKADGPVVQLETSEGIILLELNRKKAPLTVDNFLNYVRKGHFDGTVFHRIMKTFMIQGGGMTADGNQKPTDRAILNEADNGLTNDNGTIAMARTGEPHSATSQFFINVADNGMLNHSGKNQRGWGYCVFGKVKDSASMQVVETIKNTPVVASGGELSKPTKTVTIKKATIISE